jgi:5-methylcytosine-specific restriction protein A
MTTLAEIEPRTLGRVMDLVREAGVDVSAWANLKGGAARAATNPKYCYEWSFVEPKKVAVFNLWHGDMEERDAVIFLRLNMRVQARTAARLKDKASWVKRAYGMDRALQAAFRDKLLVRVILVAGVMRNMEDENPEASQVKVRELDQSSWAITSYDWETGNCILTRGRTVAAEIVADAAAVPGAAAKAIEQKPGPFMDQFSIEASPRDPEYRDATGRVFVRSAAVRDRVLARAAGRCELCGAPGFVMDDGRIFLETHHIEPLAEGGRDVDENVAALCPNDHREAHFGARRSEIRLSLQAVVVARAS